MGLPGTGKTVIKDVLQQTTGKLTLVITVARTLHTYTNTVKLLCQAFNIEFKGDSFKCEKRLIEEAYALKRTGRSLLIIIDDAHLMDMMTLRKLRLLFEDFPKSQHHPHRPARSPQQHLAERQRRHQKPRHLLRHHQTPQSTMTATARNLFAFLCCFILETIGNILPQKP